MSKRLEPASAALCGVETGGRGVFAGVIQGDGITPRGPTGSHVHPGAGGGEVVGALAQGHGGQEA